MPEECGSWRWEAYVPLLPDTPLSFAFYQYAARLNLSLRYDPAKSPTPRPAISSDQYLTE